MSKCDMEKCDECEKIENCLKPFDFETIILLDFMKNMEVDGDIKIIGDELWFETFDLIKLEDIEYLKKAYNITDIQFQGASFPGCMNVILIGFKECGK